MCLCKVALLLVFTACTDAAAGNPPHAVPFLRGSGGSVAPLSNTSLTTSDSSQKCGGAIGGQDDKTCKEALWDPTHDESMYCFEYGSACTLNCYATNHDTGKDPSQCNTADTTFYLWDEPDTNCNIIGANPYTWAGQTWLTYSKQWSKEILAMRAKGFKFTTALVKDGGALVENLNAFYEGCGAPCSDESAAAYIAVNAVNAFCGSWNQGDCAAGARDVTSRAETVAQQRPVYVTNWSYIGSDATVSLEVQAMQGTSGFFESPSSVERVYWFGAEDDGGGSGKSVTYLMNEVPGGDGKTMGDVWAETCRTL